ncbi:pyruvate dehydrogenase complex dihydrolipoamide acetyltransferase [Wolbachia endosymbiont of Pentalonia nigronervosa]|uniref:pyruvate dehydrogenase complex dihydrolipoamide acetyltransferase n=1 Tax=Wolbachia endosymbiont of Pentalonia nigronervosa TaxID=1301914 RepID=UPI00165ECF21|nr:pyruvate dehydrogenase complex dihydrolipoamide acetyltransferase [Wolbachia endosymbiont of Pentalonia nigronervosa]MBD0390913.1 pyruvate dehydrogenase complex dihydrolipoamide acetyltransferase [Wolbachia endosymbiont of Pentalonia nigronervosa]
MPIEILMPALSPTMSKTGGKIVKWHKKEQDKVEVGDVIAEIETDKAVMEFESVDEGTMAKILVPEGTSGVPVNQLIALILEEEEDQNALNNYTAASSRSNDEAKKDETKKEDKEKPNVEILQNDEDRIKISPIAKRIAQSEGINTSQLKGTGPYGRIIKADILSSDVKLEDYERTNTEDIATEVSNMRQIIAQRLVESKQTIPHFYLTVDCKIDKLISLKNEINTTIENSKVTINDLVIKAVALSMRKFPEINSSWISNKILKYSNVDISIAVALDDGLITPIVKNADKKSILSISQEVKALASKAKSGKLKPEEFQGGGFTISNLGMFGIKTFSAIINPPQSCIMAVGASEKRPIVENEKVEIAEMMAVTLSVDHRAVDGALGAKFLNTFKHYVENPLSMLI